MSELSGLSAEELEAELARRRATTSVPWVPPTNRGTIYMIIVAAIAAAAVIAWQSGLFNHGVTDRSASIASSIGASSCNLTGYAIVSKLNNSKTPVYDCTMNDGTEKCVTNENGINNDSTALVKLLFQSALSGGKPTCAN